MQSRDEIDRLVDTSILGDVEKVANLGEIVQRIEAARSKGAVSHVIASLPKAGDIVEIHGLTYKVKYSSPGRGKMVLELENPS